MKDTDSVDEKAEKKPAKVKPKGGRKFALIAVVVCFVWGNMHSRVMADVSTDTGSWWETMYHSLWDWIVDAMLTVGNKFLGNLLEVMPQSWQAGISGLGPYIGAANYWAPITEGLALMAIYYTFLAAFVTVKYILKLIPGIG